jgi:hypothetical protein
MHLLTNTEVVQISGGSYSIHINTSIPLDYIPIVSKFIEEAGNYDNVEAVDFYKLIDALNQAGLDASKVQLNVDIIYSTSYYI